MEPPISKCFPYNVWSSGLKRVGRSCCYCNLIMLPRCYGYLYISFQKRRNNFTETRHLINELSLQSLKKSVAPSGRSFNHRGIDNYKSDGITTSENERHPQDSQLVSSADHQINEEVFLSNQSGSKLNRLEIEDAFNISVNILPFWLCTFLVSCNALHLCIRLEGNCDTIGLKWIWDVFMLQSVYNPMM
jgi:hypothetical protein